MPLSPRKARHFSPRAGEADIKEKEVWFLILDKYVSLLSLAGFFAGRYKLFLLLSFRFCLLFKNDIDFLFADDIESFVLYPL